MKVVAARRLIAILLVLLFLSSLAAALAPVQPGTETTSSTTSSGTAPAAEAPALPGGALGEPRVIDQSIHASDDRPALIRARVGDQLQLRVTSRRSGTVELQGLGPAEDVGAGQPAFFDVLLRDDGSYPVRFLDRKRQIARIRVSPARTIAG